MKLSPLFTLISLSATAQTATPGHPTTDAEKIADALKAAPPAITDRATIVDWPTTPTGEYRVLRTGCNEWSCLPAFPPAPGDEPGFDRVFMQWLKDLYLNTSRADKMLAELRYLAEHLPGDKRTQDWYGAYKKAYDFGNDGPIETSKLRRPP